MRFVWNSKLWESNQNLARPRGKGDRPRRILHSTEVELLFETPDVGLARDLSGNRSTIEQSPVRDPIGQLGVLSKTVNSAQPSPADIPKSPMPVTPRSTDT